MLCVPYDVKLTPFLTFDLMESSHQYPRNHLGVVMRFVSLWPGCVAGLGDMMSEREREREMLWHWSWHLDTTWAGASTAWAAITSPVLCTVPPSSAADGGGDEDEDHPGGQGRGWPQGDDGCCQRLVRLIPSSIASRLSIQRLHEHHNQPSAAENTGINTEMAAAWVPGAAIGQPRPQCCWLDQSETAWHRW